MSIEDFNMAETFLKRLQTSLFMKIDKNIQKIWIAIHYF